MNRRTLSVVAARHPKPFVLDPWQIESWLAYIESHAEIVTGAKGERAIRISNSPKVAPTAGQKGDENAA